MLLCGGQQSTFAQTEYKEELRGVWITNVDSDVLFNKEKLAEAMDYLKSQGFNVIFPVVWNKGYTLHPSEVAFEQIGVRQDPFFANQGRDPLAEIIVEAHRVGLEVMPWFEFGFASSFSLNGGHIIAKNPHWASKDVSGNLVVKNGFDWMNAIHPEVQQFMLDMIQEVLDNYDVDGIQGDDRLPAMAAEAGYDDYTIELYKSEHGGQEPSSQFNENTFLLWKADKLTNFGGRMYRMVKNHDPNLIVSLSPSLFDFSLRQYLQDWPTWLDSGYVDIIHPQTYRYNISDFKNEILRFVGPEPGSPHGLVKPEDRHKLFPGVIIKAGSNLSDPGYVKQAVSFMREYGIQGEVFFFYEGLRERNQFVGDTLGKLFYNEPAVLPYREGRIHRPEAIVIHETSTDVERSGNWSINNTPDGFAGKTLQANPGSGAGLRYFADVPYEAYYNVYAWNAFSNQATSGVEYTALGLEGEVSATFNQRILINKGWNLIGNVKLNRGLQQVARVNADSVTDGRPLFADAVMLVLDRKKSPDIQIDVVVTDLEDEEIALTRPTHVQLYQNFPNPFNPSTTITFDLAQASTVSLEVFNMIGQRVATLIQHRTMISGTHQVQFDARNLASGSYIYRLRTETQSLTKTLTLIK